MTTTQSISLFGLLQTEFATVLPTLRCTKATLVHLSHTLEDMVLSERLPALLFTGFQESSHWREETERYRALADVAQQVCIFAGGQLPPESSASELHITLGGDDPLRQEWFLLLLCPQFSVLLCGQDRQEATEEEATRQFDTLWSFSPPIVSRVLDLLETVIASYRPERVQALQQARQQFPLVQPDQDLVTRFTAEMIRFEEQLHQRLLATTAALNAQLRWRDDLLATLVHDMRTPLQGIVTALQLLEMAQALDDENTQLLAIARRSTVQLQEQVQLILDTNQLADGQLRLNWQQLDAQQFLTEALEPLYAIAGQHQLKLTTEILPDAITFWGDEPLLRRLVQNLVSNAIKFTPAGGRISVRLSPAPSSGYLELRVRDSGRGITPTMLPLIFERLYQGPDSDRRGSGLGLYFCRLAIEAHGGSIRAESQVGLGTAITVVLLKKLPLSALHL